MPLLPPDRLREILQVHESESGGGADGGGGANASSSHPSLTSQTPAGCLRYGRDPASNISVSKQEALHGAAERGGEINSDALSCLSAVGLRCHGNLFAPSSIPTSSPSRQCPLPLNTERQ